MKSYEENPCLATALNDLLEVVEWLTMSGNIKSPITPHPYGLAVMMAKQNARRELSKAAKEP